MQMSYPFTKQMDSKYTLVVDIHTLLNISFFKETVVLFAFSLSNHK